jgi:hypothetical protein
MLTNLASVVGSMEKLIWLAKNWSLHSAFFFFFLLNGFLSLFHLLLFGKQWIIGKYSQHSVIYNSYTPRAWWAMSCCWQGRRWVISPLRILIQYLPRVPQSPWNHLSDPRRRLAPTAPELKNQSIDSNPIKGANLETLTGNETLTSTKVNRWPPSEDTAQLSLRTGPQVVWKEGGFPTLYPGKTDWAMFEMRGREGTFENEGLFQKWIAGEIISLV